MARIHRVFQRHSLGWQPWICAASVLNFSWRRADIVLYPIAFDGDYAPTQTWRTCDADVRDEWCFQSHNADKLRILGC